MDSCNHTKLVPILIWSEDEDAYQKAVDLLQTEFAENFVILTLNELPTLLKNAKKTKKLIHHELENYDFDVIKIFESFIELILKDSKRFRINRSVDLEKDIELVVRKIIQIS